MIKTKITKCNKHHGTPISEVGVFDLPQVPDKSEVLEIDGTKYAIFSRLWRIEGATLYCDLRVI